MMLLAAGIFFAGCSSSRYYEIPTDLKTDQNKQAFLNKYSKFVSDKKFFLDPGHGGEDRRNTGFENKVVEADINLRVALALKNYLEEAGADVIMSRDKDETVDLKERSYMADRSGADFFISVHHNAPGKDGDIYTNYTSTYYHAKPGDYEYEPMEHDMAKYVQRDMAYAMRNSGGLNSFDGTYSDYWIYPGAGFSVLRVTKIPAILVECGFNTSHFEGERLTDEEYNKIEAWGIFRGLCRYFAAGLPKITYLNPEKPLPSGDLNFSFLLSDSIEIDPASVKVQFDSIFVQDCGFNKQNNILSVDVPDVQEGSHEIRIIAANKNGNHALPFHQEILVLKK